MYTAVLILYSVRQFYLKIGDHMNGIYKHTFIHRGHKDNIKQSVILSKYPRLYLQNRINQRLALPTDRAISKLE